MRKQSETITKNMKIYVKNNDVGKALRIMNKKMLAEGIMKEARENAFFRSKGEKKRLAEKAGKKRWQKKRLQLEERFIREERNMIRNSRKKKRPYNNKTK